MSADRKFMLQALREMRKSRSEHIDKADPLVAAVLVDKNAKLLGAAHRGSLRVGDHAEYTLIERHLHSMDLEGATLYVTLEPCTSRGPGKTPCAKHIVAARIGRVVIGIPDPNPEIEGKGITYLLNKGVEVDFFDQDLADEIRRENAEFVAYFAQQDDPVATTEEFEGPSDVERAVVVAAELSDLSEDLIRQYITDLKRNVSVPSPELWTLFEKRNFVKTQSGAITPTLAGVLLFATNPGDLLPQSKVLLEAHDASGRVSTKDGCGPLATLPKAIEQFLTEHMRTFTVIKGFDRTSAPEYPIEALREAVMNALAHRDYRAGAHVIVRMEPGRLTVSSPGLPPKPITLERIRTFNTVAFSRNPRIAATLVEMGFMEQRGWGLRKMRDHLTEANLPAPRFDIDTGCFVVTFVHQTLPRREAALDDQQRKVLALTRKKKGVTVRQAADKLKLPPRTVRRRLAELRELGLVERKGKGPSTHYVPVE